MLQWLKDRFKAPTPAGPPQVLRRFTIADPPLDQGAVAVEGEAWRISASAALTVRLFEVADPGLEKCMLTYRARMRTQDLKDKAYLEMWCRLPGGGEFFSKGLNHAVTGTVDWASYETPFYLKAGQRPDLIKLNVTLKGPGPVWLDEVELLWTALA